jgi:hypothetical protein
VSYATADQIGGNGAMSEQELGHIRYFLQLLLEPWCIDKDGVELREPLGHIGHKQCKPRNSFIFILPDKRTVLRNFRALGCDLEKQYVTRNTV